MWNQKLILSKTIILSVVIILSGCANTVLKGVTPEGNNVYIGPVPINNTLAYQEFIKSQRTELDRIQYLLNRVKTAPDIRYERDGVSFNSDKTYQTGLWLVGNSYNKNTDAITFLRNHVWFAKPSMAPHLAHFPDGTTHVAYYIFINELALLDESIQNE